MCCTLNKIKKYSLKKRSDRMNFKLSIGMLVLCVSVLVLMSNVLASIGPGAWINQATLSIIDSNPSQDPENSGYGTLQVVVWEEWNGNDWDIHMKYSNLDGALGSWIFPPVHPATTPGVDEINPAVAVTNADPTGVFQIHVVYEFIDTTVVPPRNDIYHTYTLNMGINWIVPAGRLNTNDAHDPAIVYSEDVSNPIPPDVWYSMAVQIVWSELNPAPVNRYEIYYNAWYFEGSAGGPWAYAIAPPASFPVRASLNGHCEKPEIAAIDETMMPGTWNFYFAIVWQEPSVAPVNTEIWYRDGWLGIAPGAIVFTIPLGNVGRLCTCPAGSGNCVDPDIAATQDYQNPAIALEEFYIHVNWVHQITGGGFRIDTCYFAGPVPFPGFGLFVTTAAAVATPTVLNRPTIAVKCIMRMPVNPFTIFQIWMCWEDSSNPASVPDIWYRVGQHNNMGPFFGFVILPAPVPYVPAISSDFNPELWNRNDAIRPVAPPFTHLVFDQGIPVGGVPEVVYIDP
jgi:hypothetical protein